jgi:hypothetical protein
MSPQRTEPSLDEVEEIPLGEVKFVVLKQKNNRSSGPDGLNYEL